MALNRDKFRKIVGGITTAADPEEAPAEQTAKAPAMPAEPEAPPLPAGQGVQPAVDNGPAEQEKPANNRRFAMRGRPKGRKHDTPEGKARKVKVSLFLDEQIINDIYDWALAEKMNPGDYLDRILRPFHEKESKRRNAGKA
jgi:hypothetical protein